jgi:hypothetical protein
MTRRITWLFAATFLLSGSILAAPPLPPTQSARALPLTCDDLALLTAGAYRVENNTWGKGNQTGWSQCVGIGAGNQDAIVARWTWNWPPHPGGVKAYPELIFGKKPSKSSTTPWLPRRLDALDELTISYDYFSAHSGKGNTGFDIWLTNSATFTRFDVPPITHEIMVWLESYGGMTPGGALLERRVIEGVTYDIYVGDHAGKGWRYIAFKRIDPAQGAATLNLKALLAYAQTRSLISGTEYVASIEFGNEIIEGTGHTLVKSYHIAIQAR